jgi:hypothetical protein
MKKATKKCEKLGLGSAKIEATKVKRFYPSLLSTLSRSTVEFILLSTNERFCRCHNKKHKEKHSPSWRVCVIRKNTQNI